MGATLAEVNLKSVFDQAASIYDQTRRQLIPCFDLFYGTAIELIPPDAKRVLDLGAGTGLLTVMVLNHAPSATVTLADVSTEMLEQAKIRLKTPSERCVFAPIDYTVELPAGPFDVIVSALSIHHLEAPAKQRLFARIFDCLAPGGIFINADQVTERNSVGGRALLRYLGRVRSRIGNCARCHVGSF